MKPAPTIKGFIDGILDGTIPPEMQNHYLQLVSEETGRLARLIQNMLDLSKLESGEYQVNARMFNIWETLAGVALSAEAAGSQWYAGIIKTEFFWKPACSSGGQPAIAQPGQSGREILQSRCRRTDRRPV